MDVDEALTRHPISISTALAARAGTGVVTASELWTAMGTRRGRGDLGEARVGSFGGDALGTSSSRRQLKLLLGEGTAGSCQRRVRRGSTVFRRARRSVRWLR